MKSRCSSARAGADALIFPCANEKRILWAIDQPIRLRTDMGSRTVRGSGTLEPGCAGRRSVLSGESPAGFQAALVVNTCLEPKTLRPVVSMAARSRSAATTGGTSRYAPDVRERSLACPVKVRMSQRSTPSRSRLVTHWLRPKFTSRPKYFAAIGVRWEVRIAVDPSFFVH